MKTAQELLANRQIPEQEITQEILTRRGFVPTTVVGSGAYCVYNKWGIELDVGMYMGNFCKTQDGRYIKTKKELLAFEFEHKIDRTPLITKMSIAQLKKMIPNGYRYVIDKRCKFIKTKDTLSFNHKRGRYKIYKGKELIAIGYNDQEESYFLMESLLFILEQENLLPRNSCPPSFQS